MLGQEDYPGTGAVSGATVDTTSGESRSGVRPCALDARLDEERSYERLLLLDACSDEGRSDDFGFDAAARTRLNPDLRADFDAFEVSHRDAGSCE